jgi:type IV secretion system protein VirB9
MMKSCTRIAARLFLLVATILACPTIASAQAMTSDSRIKTLIYDPSEVYAITTHFGYQSNIEFDRNERISTISVGDLVSWQIIPADTHLFIRALSEDAHTNMTVITDRRSYQFDLFSKPLKSSGSKDLAYVIRFYYPDEYTSGAPTPAGGMMSGGMSGYDAAPPPQSPMPSFPAPIDGPGSSNFNYTISGPGEIAPVKIYDDGRTTYFQFASPELRPTINIVDISTGKETPAQTIPQGNMLAVPYVGSRFSVRANGKVVCVFNGGGAPTPRGGAW